MQTWWGIYDPDANDSEPVAIFKQKGHAFSFNKTYKGDVRACFFYETEEEAQFLEEAENIW